MEENHLKMNDAKTEFMVLGTANNLKKTSWITLKLEMQKFNRLQKLNFLEYCWMKSWASSTTFKTDKKANYNLMLIHNIGNH